MCLDLGLGLLIGDIAKLQDNIDCSQLVLKIPFRNRPKTHTVVGPNKGTQIRENFPYLSQNSEILQIREYPKFPYLIKNFVKNC